MQKDDMSSSSCRAAKRPRHSANNGGDADRPLDLLSLYQSDLGDRILSYASGADLCTFDALNKKFKSLTTEQWNIVTKDRFGMNNGKEGWKIGTSFLRRPIFVHDVSDFGDEGDPGSPRVATNESIVVDVSDMASGIEIRTASTLNTIVNTASSRPSSVNSNWKVAICGRVGAEIIVTSNNNKICAWDNVNPSGINFDFDTSSSSGIEIIGCETHLLVSHGGQIQVYEVNHEQERGPDNNDTELLSLRKDIRVEEGPADEYEAMDRRLAWSPDKTHFIVGYPHRICIWKLDAANNEITLVKTITVSDWEVTNVALSEDYIVASSKNKKVHIWKRSTGEKMVFGLQGGTGTTRDALCDVGVYDELDHEEEVVWPLSLSCHGSILVSTSHIGCALCIWDMKTGKLLKRHNEASEEGVAEMLTTGIADVTDMAYLKRMNAFLCMGEFENMWVFPANQRQYDVAASIRNRVSQALLDRENALESETRE